MAAYATFLALGHSLLCKSILADTIEKYLVAVSDLFLVNGSYNPTRDPIKPQCKAPCIKAVIAGMQGT